MEDRYNIDRNRIYITGLSIGGTGAWALAAKSPHRFAAIAPICGDGDPEWAVQLKTVPVWAFHGAKDDAIPLAASERMVQAIQTVGGDARLTVYPEGEHNCWDETYRNPELYRWLLAHRLSDRKSP
jgi:predicted peptidase